MFLFCLIYKKTAKIIMQANSNFKCFFMTNFYFSLNR